MIQVVCLVETCWADPNMISCLKRGGVKPWYHVWNVDSKHDHACLKRKRHQVIETRLTRLPSKTNTHNNFSDSLFVFPVQNGPKWSKKFFGPFWTILDRVFDSFVFPNSIFTKCVDARRHHRRQYNYYLWFMMLLLVLWRLINGHAMI